MKIILHLEVMRYIKSYQDIYRITLNWFLFTEYDWILLNTNRISIKVENNNSKYKP